MIFWNKKCGLFIISCMLTVPLCAGSTASESSEHDNSFETTSQSFFQQHKKKIIGGAIGAVAGLLLLYIVTKHFKNKKSLSPNTTVEADGFSKTGEGMIVGKQSLSQASGDSSSGEGDGSNLASQKEIEESNALKNSGLKRFDEYRGW